MRKGRLYCTVYHFIAKVFVVTDYEYTLYKYDNKFNGCLFLKILKAGVNS